MLLRPWEFYEYTFEDFLLAARGYRDGERDLLKKFRLVAWATIAPHAKDFPRNPQDWMPLDGEQAESATSLEEALAFKQSLYDRGILRSKN